MPNSADFLAALSKSTTRDTGVYNCIQKEFRASIDQQSLLYAMLSSGLGILQKRYSGTLFLVQYRLT